MKHLDVPCTDCGELTRVREYPSTLYEPADADPTECSDPDCGGPLDWSRAEPADLDADEADRAYDLGRCADTQSATTL